MKPTMFRRSVLAGVALLCGSAMALSAFAKGMDPETRAEVIEYQDLNLATPQAVQILYRRIENAADRVCGRVSPREMAAFDKYRECRGRAVTDAVKQNDIPALTALHRDKAVRARA
jgi:UrcA family protein